MKIPIDHKKYKIEESFATWVINTIRLVHGRLLENFKDSGHVDVKLDHWRVLIHIWSYEGLCQNELSLNADKNQTYITRILDLLESRHLVVRIPHQMDRRAKQLYLTPQGRKLMQQLIEVAQKTLGEALEGIDQNDYEICHRVLARVQTNLKAD